MDLEMLSQIFSKKNFKACVSHMYSAFKRFYVTAFFYCLTGAVTYGIAIVVPMSLMRIGVPNDCCDVIMKILLTIAPAFPVLTLSFLERDDEYYEISMDLGFVAWLATVILAWKFL